LACIGVTIAIGVADADGALAVTVESGITCNGDLAENLANALVVVAVAYGAHEVRVPGSALEVSLRAAVAVDLGYSARLVAKGLAHLGGGNIGVGRVAETAVFGAAASVGGVHRVAPDNSVAERLVGSTQGAARVAWPSAEFHAISLVLADEIACLAAVAVAANPLETTVTVPGEVDTLGRCPPHFYGGDSLGARGGVASALDIGRLRAVEAGVAESRAEMGKIRLDVALADASRTIFGRRTASRAHAGGGLTMARTIFALVARKAGVTGAAACGA
jgi:hypothetical protein